MALRATWLASLETQVSLPTKHVFVVSDDTCDVADEKRRSRCLATTSELLLGCSLSALIGQTSTPEEGNRGSWVVPEVFRTEWLYVRVYDV